ncbi:MAG: hypothetical protein AAF333_15605 [Planctomycetota bacterium]
MNARFLWVAGATVLAAAVFALATIFGGSGPATSTGPAPAPPNVSGLGVSSADLDAENDGNVQPIAGARGFEVFSDDGETITRFTGQELIPQADFVADVTRPVAEVRFSDAKLLLITAASGRFHHPGNVPTRGEFNTNTVVTQYQAPDGEPIDFDSNEHVQFRLYLDELTTFDQQRGHIRSQGPVRLVAPDLDFTGRGLDLTFNRLLERIEELIIEHGDELRIAADAGFSPTTDTSSQASATGSEPAPGLDPGSGSATPEPLQHYHATLLDDIRITVGPDEAQLAGDRLEATFALNPQSPGAAPNPAGASAKTSNPSTPAPDDDGPLYFVNAPAPTVPAPTKPRGLLTPSPDDVVVRWSGRLEMRPLAEPSSELLAADDAVFRLHGGEQPARIDTVRDEHITAAVVGYRTAGRQVFAEESADHKLSIQAPDLGELSSKTLLVSQDTGVGQLAGPGRLLTENAELDVTFRDRLDLAFAPGADGRLDMIESATFRGDVNAKADSDDPDKRLDLDSQTLALTLTRDADGNPQPSHLQAAAAPGELVTAVQGDNTTFAAEQLDVDLAKPDATSSEASDPILAEGEGEAASGDATLASGSQSVVPDGRGDFEITRLRALRRVRVERPDEQLTVTAHALDADPRINRLALFGENDQTYATLTRGEDTLEGVHLILLEDQQSADALGPGRFSARTDENDPTARINVQWTDTMSFNNAEGTAFFAGAVESASTSATDDTTLWAHTLALEFAPQDFDTADADTAAAEPADDLQAPTPLSGDILDLRRAHALADPERPEDQVIFTAQTFAADDATQAPLTRIRTESRELAFLNLPPNLANDSPIDDEIRIERLLMPGRGRMLLEDYRTPPPDQTEAGETPVVFAGRGQTLFDWGKSLTLDLVTNDLRIEGDGELDVYMAHNPNPERNDLAELVTLQSQVLVADLTETGGLGAYVNGQPPEIQIRNVTATGRVRLEQDTTNIEADHMEYEEAKRSVLFWAEPRRRAQLDLDGTVTTAKGYRWDLDTNEFTSIEPGASVIPVE